MAAKLLHSLADDNPDLRKQIGCMTGIFQLFDRQHILTGRRISHKRLPAGNSHLYAANLGREYNGIHIQAPGTEMAFNGSMHEKNGIPAESSRVSFSSSCSSSLSSAECNRATPLETSSFDRVIFPETPSRDPAQFGRQPLDLREVVKDSMYREARTSSLQNIVKEEALNRPVKHRDSPQPLQMSKSITADGTSKAGRKEKQKTPVDLKESLRVLAKLRDAPWNHNDAQELPRSSSETRDRSYQSRDAPRYSYDGRELHQLSFESRDSIRPSGKLKELPRLSLDGRESLVRNTGSISMSTPFSNSFDNTKSSSDGGPEMAKSSGSQKRPPSVVAKLMGLEALPNSPLARSQLDCDHFANTLANNGFIRPIKMSEPQRSFMKGPTSPRWKTPDVIMRPVSTSKFPIETAPWRHQDGSRSHQKPILRPVKSPARTPNSFPSVYREIESRLKDLEFRQSGKDLRALKQILEAMQTKGLLDSRNQEQTLNLGSQRENEPKCVSPSQTTRMMSQQRRRGNKPPASSTYGLNSSRTYESPIVIMKPAKLVGKSGVPASSVIPIDGLPGLQRLQNRGLQESKKSPSGSVSVKAQSSGDNRRDSVVGSSEKKASSRNSRPSQSSSRPEQLPKGNAYSTKGTGSVSPRLQKKKLELEKRSRPPTPPSDSNKPRRKINRPVTEMGSPCGKMRPKSSDLQQCDDQLSEISNESRTLSYQGDDISLQSDSNLSLDSKTDIEVTSGEQMTEIDVTPSIPTKAIKYLPPGLMANDSTLRCEERSRTELAAIAPEHPSPVSVLDSSVYRDDEPSPVKQILNSRKHDVLDSQDNVGEEPWNGTACGLSESLGSGLTSEINRKKLENIDNLVQKLRRLNSHHDEAKTDYIASLCENPDPDHRYISEMLLASGLLLRDLGSGLTSFQLHPSGHPINPELFYVLEQTKGTGLLTKEEFSPLITPNAKLNQEKFHRKLIFDAVNEILAGKLSLLRGSREPWLKANKLARKNMSAQKLLKVLCFEIEQFQAKKTECILQDEEDSLKGVLWVDVMHRSGNWTDFQNETSGVVLDVERSIFKDLIDEIVIGEEAQLRGKMGRRRQLFAK